MRINAKVALIIAALVLFVIVMMSGSLWAQDKSELAKKTQIPVADLIRVPLQNNLDCDARSIRDTR